VQQSTGINEIAVAPTYSVYPNPSTQNIFIDGKAGFIYKLFDMNGRVVLQSLKVTTDHEQIDTDELKQGVYFLYIISGDRTEKYKIEKI
jgi:hypothetical protein